MTRPQQPRATLSSKSTIKMPVASIAVLGSNLYSAEKSKHAQLLGKEIARHDHAVCISEITSATKAVVAGAERHQGMVIGYLQSLAKLNGLNRENFTQLILTNSDYDNSIELMFRSSSAVIVLGDSSDSLRMFTQPMPTTTTLGYLTDSSDQSAQVIDVLTLSGLPAESVLIDSSPLNLVKRILKRLRQQQLQIQTTLKL